MYLRPCLRSQKFPVWRFVNADWESRAPSRRALGRATARTVGWLMELSLCLIIVFLQRPIANSFDLRWIAVGFCSPPEVIPSARLQFCPEE